MYKPGDRYYKLFPTATPSTGAATNADALPTATANHNGTDDSTFALTVMNLSTGRYLISGTVPSGYVKGDVVSISVNATCGGIPGVAVVETFTVDSKRIGDLNDIAATSIVTGGAITTSSGKVSEVALVDANGDKTGYTLASFGFTVAPTASENATAVAATMATAPVGSVATGVTVSDKTGFSLASTGLNAIAGANGWSFPQMLRAVAGFLLLKRSGVPSSGSAGTATYTNATAGDYGTVTVDANGNITANNMTPTA